VKRDGDILLRGLGDAIGGSVGLIDHLLQNRLQRFNPRFFLVRGMTGAAFWVGVTAHPTAEWIAR
jgi:hypothetical protein